METINHYGNLFLGTVRNKQKRIIIECARSIEPLTERKVFLPCRIHPAAIERICHARIPDFDFY